jgi:hypothetical protein
MHLLRSSPGIATTIKAPFGIILRHRDDTLAFRYYAVPQNLGIMKDFARSGKPPAERGFARSLAFKSYKKDA